MRAGGRTPHEVQLSNGYNRGEIVWARARVPGTRLPRGKFEVNWLELVWLDKTESSDEHLCGDEHLVRKFRTIRRQLETARWRGEDVDKLFGDHFNPKPKCLVATNREEASKERARHRSACTSPSAGDGSKESCCSRVRPKDDAQRQSTATT